MSNTYTEYGNFHCTKLYYFAKKLYRILSNIYIMILVIGNRCKTVDTTWKLDAHLPHQVFMRLYLMIITLILCHVNHWFFFSWLTIRIKSLNDNVKELSLIVKWLSLKINISCTDNSSDYYYRCMIHYLQVFSYKERQIMWLGTMPLTKYCTKRILHAGGRDWNTPFVIVGVHIS
jgi:hypothetical protein